MNNIALIGFMGTGKTTVGRVLGEMLGYMFADVDQEVESEQGVSIAHIFSELGESYFRLLERDMIKSLSGKRDLIISAGGGAVLDVRNVDEMKRGGLLVCLTAQPEVILRRVQGNSSRPLLQVPDPLARIRELMAARQQFYALADYTIDTSGLTVKETAAQVMAITKKKARL
jgi:shikimate kinase